MIRIADHMSLGYDVQHTCVTPDGKHVVSSVNETIQITRVQDKKLVREIKGHTDIIWSICVTLDCKLYPAFALWFLHILP